MQVQVNTRVEKKMHAFRSIIRSVKHASCEGNVALQEAVIIDHHDEPLGFDKILQVAQK